MNIPPVLVLPPEDAPGQGVNGQTHVWCSITNKALIRHL